MILGALIDAGVKLEDVRQALGSLAITPDTIWTEPVVRGGIRATKFNVRGEAHPPDAPHHHHDHAHEHTHAQAGESRHRTLPEILCLIDSSSLSTRARIARRSSSPARRGRGRHPRHVARRRSICTRSARSTRSSISSAPCSRSSGSAPTAIVSSPLNVGGGTVHSAHGVFPVPAPATVRLLKGAPIYSGAEQEELVTPTGALLVTGYARRSARCRRCASSASATAPATRDFPTSPNVLRVLIGEAGCRRAEPPVVVIECEIDDMNPQMFGVADGRLLRGRRARRLLRAGPDEEEPARARC